MKTKRHYLLMVGLLCFFARVASGQEETKVSTGLKDGHTIVIVKEADGEESWFYARGCKRLTVSIETPYRCEKCYAEYEEEQAKEKAEADKKKAENKARKEAEKQQAEEERRESEQDITTDSDTWDSDGDDETDEDAEAGEEESEAEEQAGASSEQYRPQVAKDEYVRQQEEKRRQRVVKQNYDNRVARQRTQNTVAASSAATSSATILVMLGGFMYQNMGRVSPEQIFTGSNLYMGLDFGYGINLTPMYLNSELTTMSSSAKLYTTKEVKSSMPLITNLNFRLKGGYEHENFGGYAFDSVAPGASLIFHAFELSGAFGGRIFAGSRGIKVFSEFETGTRSLSLDPWIDPEETGTGKTKIKFTNLKLGLKFSWYSGSADPARNHLILGVINETINEEIEKDDDLGDFMIRDIYPDMTEAQTGLFSMLYKEKLSYTGSGGMAS